VLAKVREKSGTLKFEVVTGRQNEVLFEPIYSLEGIVAEVALVAMIIKGVFIC
jgi:hypothetical protein